MAGNEFVKLKTRVEKQETTIANIKKQLENAVNDLYDIEDTLSAYKSRNDNAATTLTNKASALQSELCTLLELLVNIADDEDWRSVYRTALQNLAYQAKS